MDLTKFTKIWHFVRVFGEFKIVEFAMPWDPDVICRGRRYFCKSLLFFDAWFCRYLSWPDTLVEVIACLRCLILMLYVVFQRTLPFYFFCRCSILMVYVVAGSTSEGQCVPSEVDFERYLSWPDIVCFFMLFFRSRLWTLVVVDPCTFGSHWFSATLDFDAVCFVL